MQKVEFGVDLPQASCEKEVSITIPDPKTGTKSFTELENALCKKNQILTTTEWPKKVFVEQKGTAEKLKKTDKTIDMHLRLVQTFYEGDAT